MVSDKMKLLTVKRGAQQVIPTPFLCMQSTQVPQPVQRPFFISLVVAASISSDLLLKCQSGVFAVG